MKESDLRNAHRRGQLGALGGSPRPFVKVGAMHKTLQLLLVEAAVVWTCVHCVL
jgi:hypothetical protein